MMASLRARLLAAVLALTACGLLLAGGITYIEQRSFQYSRVDQELKAAVFPVSGALEHRRRRIQDRDLVPGSGQRHALVPGAAADIDHALRLGPEVRTEVLVHDVRANSAAQRPVVLVDEASGEGRPHVV